MRSAIRTVALALALLAPVAGAQAEEHEDRFSALLEYRQRHLDIRGYTVLRGGGVHVIQERWVWGWGPFWGPGRTTVIREPITEEHRWAVFQGNQRLTVPVYHDLVGNDEVARDLRRRIELRRRSASSLLGIGVGGLTATLVGLAGMALATAPSQYYGFGMLAAVGGGGMLVGFVGGAAAAGAAAQARHDFGTMMTPDVVHQEVADYNERLRGELGLTRAQTRRFLRER